MDGESITSIDGGMLFPAILCTIILMEEYQSQIVEEFYSYHSCYIV